MRDPGPWMSNGCAVVQRLSLTPTRDRPKSPHCPKDGTYDTQFQETNYKRRGSIRLRWSTIWRKPGHRGPSRSGKTFGSHYRRSLVRERAALGLVRAVLGIILLMLAIDLFAHRKAHIISVKEAVAPGRPSGRARVGFGGVIWWWAGSEFAAQYYAGYLIEKSLAIDNVFVWAIISATSRCPGSTSTGAVLRRAGRWSSAASSSRPARR